MGMMKYMVICTQFIFKYMIVIGNKWRYTTSVFFHWYEINQEWFIKQNRPYLSKENSWMDIHESFQVDKESLCLEGTSVPPQNRNHVYTRYVQIS